MVSNKVGMVVTLLSGILRGGDVCCCSLRTFVGHGLQDQQIRLLHHLKMQFISTIALLVVIHLKMTKIVLIDRVHNPKEKNYIQKLQEYFPINYTPITKSLLLLFKYFQCR